MRTHQCRFKIVSVLSWVPGSRVAEEGEVRKLRTAALPPDLGTQPETNRHGRIEIRQ